MLWKNLIASEMYKFLKQYETENGNNTIDVIIRILKQLGFDHIAQFIMDYSLEALGHLKLIKFIFDLIAYSERCNDIKFLKELAEKLLIRKAFLIFGGVGIGAVTGFIFKKLYSGPFQGLLSESFVGK
jgi:hypothetical protein